jgi:GTP-binding protein
LDITVAEYVRVAPAPVLPEVAVAGRSNVGKSSLLNALLMRKGLVKTSSTPGCTRYPQFFRTETRSGFSLYFVDLPGYGFADRSKAEKREWAGHIEQYLRERIVLKLVLSLIDVRRGMQPDDFELLEFVETQVPNRAPVQSLIVVTKIDELPKNKRKPALMAIAKESGRRAIGFSSYEDIGRLEVFSAIERAILGVPTVVESTEKPSP